MIISTYSEYSFIFELNIPSKIQHWLRSYTCVHCWCIATGTDSQIAPFLCADQQEEDGDDVAYSPTNERLVERRIARQRECIAQVQTHIEGLLSCSPDVRGAKLLQDEMIRELARLQACRRLGRIQSFFNRRLATEAPSRFPGCRALDRFNESASGRDACAGPD